jgi:hypothetical protein
MLKATPTGVALCLSLFNCFVDLVPANAVSSSIVGLMYGPIFPGAMAFCNELLPHKMHMVSMALLYVPIVTRSRAHSRRHLSPGLLSQVLGLVRKYHLFYILFLLFDGLYSAFPILNRLALQCAGYAGLSLYLHCSDRELGRFVVLVSLFQACCLRGNCLKKFGAIPESAMVKDFVLAVTC